MQKIIPHLWFDKEASEAVEFYTSVFPNSKVISKTTIEGTPSGNCDILSFEIMNFRFEAISAGVQFTPNPSISFLINFDPSQDNNAKKRIDEVWEKLLEGGKVLMPIDEYPFSKRYGWVQDKYGFSWQLIYTEPEGDERPVVIPAFLFVSDTGKQAEEASNFYMSVFKNAKLGMKEYYPADMKPNAEDSIMFTDFTLEDQWFAAMDEDTKTHDFTFNEALSFIVHCKDQAEIDYYWEKLCAVPNSGQCGWLKDRFGVSWQVLPHNLNELLQNSDKVQKMLKMKKIIISDLL